MTTIQERIAALNLNQVNRTPTDPPPSYDRAISEQPAVRRNKGPPPPLPSRPARPSRPVANGNTTNGGVVSPASYGSASIGIVLPRQPLRPPPRPSSVFSVDSVEETPVLPPRRTSTATTDEPSPQLPPRRPSGPAVDRRSSYHWQRRGSNDSTMSAISTTSGVSVGSRRRVLAPEYDPASLPPLPARRPKEPVEETPRLPMRSPISFPTVPKMSQPKSVPPLPSRPALPTRTSASPSARFDGGPPPPIPVSSRPNIAAIQASKPKPTAAPVSCLVCRDFSGPDAHAARFPRESIPSHDIHWIARELTAPFTGPTDKARAIFTWLHHNIAYDARAFFGNNVQGSTPASTMASGLAVCEGYAVLFNAMALAAGVESIVVTGHGKGIGYSDPDPNNLPPPNPSGHAWSAFRLDDGQWKLTDPCWGAGYCRSEQKDYIKAFKPIRFTQPNDDFGIDHFPSTPGGFFRSDGRVLDWTEYMLLGADKPNTMGGWSEEGWREQSLQPRGKSIQVSGGAASSSNTIRFLFTKVCPHWDPVRNGPGPQYLPFVEINGRGGAKKQSIPFECDAYNYWVDVPLADIGTPGQQVKLMYMNQMDGKEARGLTIEGWNRFMGENRAKGWSWSILAVWEIV